MEELQDALEDAQYVNAINVDEGPRPVTRWINPSEETLNEWKTKLLVQWESLEDKTSEPKPLSFEWTLNSTLGLFLFSTYVKEGCGEYVQMCFIEEVLRWRCLRGRSRGMKLRKIFERYLTPCESAIDDVTNQCTKVLPAMTVIDELDMVYSHNGEKLSDQVLNDLIKANVNDDTSACCIGIDGPLRDKIVEPIEKALSTCVQQQLEGDSLDIIESLGKPHNLPDFSSAPEVSTNDEHNQNIDEKKDGDDHGGSKEEAPRQKTFICSRSAALSEMPDNLFDEIEQVVLECLRRKYWQKFAQKGNPFWEKLLYFLWHKDQPPVEEDFYLMRVLGRGGFGLVTACKKGTTGKLYAMKVMNKKRIKAKKSSNLALSELSVLKEVTSPFVVNLKYSFQTKEDLYLILDLMTGGDLSFHLCQRRRFSREQCLYYAARIMLGLQALHDKNFVYRDLKPENLLLAEDGRVRITDLGLATKVTSRLHGAAGTRGYWAPEMLKRDENGKRLNYDQNVDWFSFGCVLAEMISGVNPFRSEAALKFGLEHEDKKEKAIDYATLNMEPMLTGKYFDAAATDLCRSLLNKDPTCRLGRNGCQEIMSHPWFNGVSWEKIISDTAKPPFIPLKDINAATQAEIGTFAEDKSATKLDDKDHAVYKHWNWTNPKVFDAEVLEMLIYERDTGRALIPLTAGGTCCCTVM